MGAASGDDVAEAGADKGPRAGAEGALCRLRRARQTKLIFSGFAFGAGARCVSESKCKAVFRHFVPCGCTRPGPCASLP